MPSINLASQRMNTGGRSGGISPVPINGSIAGNVRAPSINVNAGNTSFTNTPVAAIKDDQTIQMAAKAGMEMSQAAFRYQQRVDQLRADESILSLQNQMRELYSGRPDEAGNISGGFGNTSKSATVAGYKGYQDSVNSAMERTLGNLTPAQSVLALNRAGALRNSALDAGSAHSSKQLGIAEKEMKEGIFVSDLAEIQAGNINLDKAASGLTRFAGDSKDFLKRDKIVTQTILNSVLEKQGPAAAEDMAASLINHPGVGNAEVVHDFRKALKAENRTDIKFEHYKQQYVRDEKSYKITETNKLIADTLGEKLPAAIISGSPSDMNALISAAVEVGDFSQKTMETISMEIRESIELSVGAANSAGDHAAVVRNISANIDQMAPQFRAEARKALSVAQVQRNENNTKIIESMNASDAANVKATEAEDGRVISNYFELVRQGESPAVTEIARQNIESQLDNMSTKAQKDWEDRINYKSPDVQAKAQKKFEDNFSYYISHPQDIYNLPLPHEELEALRQRSKAHRNNMILPQVKKNLRTELESFFPGASTKSSMSGAITVEIGGEKVTGGGDKKSVDAEMQVHATEAYNRITRRAYDLLNKEGSNLSADEAFDTAFATVASSEWFKSVAKNKPEGSPGKDKEKKTDVTYTGNLDEVSMRYPVPAKVENLEGEADLSKWVKNMGNNTYSVPEGSYGVPPRMALSKRSIDVVDALNRGLMEATTAGEISRISREKRNALMQYQYMRDVVPEVGYRWIEYTAPGEWRIHDGDTIIPRDEALESVRFDDTAAAEMETARGIAEHAYLSAASKILSPGIVMEIKHNGDTDVFARTLAKEINVAGQDMQAISKEGGADKYKPRAQGSDK